MSEYFQPLYDVLFDLYDSISIQKDISFGDLLAAVSIFLAVYPTSNLLGSFCLSHPSFRGTKPERELHQVC